MLFTKVVQVLCTYNRMKEKLTILWGGGGGGGIALCIYSFVSSFLHTNTRLLWNIFSQFVKNAINTTKFLA